MEVQQSNHLVCNGNDETINSDIQHEIRIQASMYISAFMLTWVLFDSHDYRDYSSPNTFPFAEIKSIQVLKVIFQPLQGFFNMLIFIYHEVSQVRRVDKDLYSTWDALKVVFCQPRNIPEIVISRIEVLHSQKYVNVPYLICLREMLVMMKIENLRVKSRDCRLVYNRRSFKREGSIIR